MTAINQATIDGIQYTITTKANDKAKNSTLKQIQDFGTTAYGTWRITQFPAKLGAVVTEAWTLSGLAEESIRPIRDATKVFNTAANGMIWGHWLWTSFQIKDQVSKVAEEGGVGEWVELGRRGIEWVTAGCHSLSSLFPSFGSILGKTAIVTELANDTIEGGQAAIKWSRADEWLTKGVGLSDEVVDGLKSEKVLNLISLIKSVVAATAGIFALLGLILGVAVVPSIVLLTMGLATCALAFVKHFYKENMAMDRINLVPV